jgi:hypothetical protein
MEESQDEMKIYKFLIIISLIFVLLTGIFEVWRNSVQQDVDDIDSDIKANNDKIILYNINEGEANDIIGIRDILIGMDQSKDFNLSSLIDLRAEDVYRYREGFIKQLEENINSTHKNIDVRNEKEYDNYKKELAATLKLKMAYLNYEYKEHRKNISSIQFWRNIFFFLAIAFQILSEWVKKN